MLSTADRYCAKISARAYRNALLPNAALRSILREEKNQSIVAAFVRELGIYPMGTFVKLENGEMAVITGKGKTSTTPIVHALIGPRGAPLPFPVERDTSVVFYEIRDVVSDVKTEAFIDMQQLWGLEASL